MRAQNASGNIAALAMTTAARSEPDKTTPRQGWTRVTGCSVCGGSNFQKRFSAEDVHYGIEGVYDLFRCAGCGLVFLNPMPDENAIGRLYPESYYSYQEHFRVSKLKELLRTLSLMRIHTRDPRFDAPGRVLDIGCGSGWFLSEWRDRGWEVYGVEVSAEAAEVGRREAGLNIFAGTLLEARFPNQYFDYVRANHAFEHIVSSHEVLDEIRRILKPEGKLLLAVPNIESLTARIFGKSWWHLCAPVHVFSYSPSTLRRLLEQHGVRVATVRYNSDFSGIVGSLQIVVNRGTQRRADQGWLVNNPLMRIIAQRVARAIDLFRAGDVIEIVSSRS